MRARTSSPSTSACKVTSTSEPFSSRSRYWLRPSWKMIASYWPEGSESWTMPSFEPDLVRRSERSSTLAARRAEVAPRRTCATKSAQRVDAQPRQHALIGLERMAGEEEADRVEFAPQPVGRRPGGGAHFERRARRSRRTERSARPPSPRRCGWRAPEPARSRRRRRARSGSSLVEGAGGGEAFQRLLVDRARIDAPRHIAQRGERALAARGDERRGLRLADAFDRR